MHTKPIKFLALSLVVALAGAGLVGCGKPDSSQTARAAGGQRYHCPMHPTYVSNRPGDCPICNMKLVLIRDDPRSKARPATPASDDKIAVVKPGQYYCPMGVEHVQDQPGKCPKCGMDLVQKQDTPAGHESHAMDAETASPVPGRIAISLSPDKRQLIGLTLAKVEKRDLTRAVRTVALVEHDETRYTRVAPRFAGWVRKLHVNFTGAPVEKDQPLFTVYSPELYSTENEYLVAWRGVGRLPADAAAARRDSAQALLESARLRLALFEIGDAEVRELEQRGQAGAELLFRAPFSGHVIVKNAVEGQAFPAGETLFEIADLSHLWLRAYVYESELPLVAAGQDAVVHFPHLNHRSFPAKVTFIYPHIEPRTRRAALRLELDNPEHLIRPDMWADVELAINTGEKLTVPAGAVIDTGQRYVAFVDGPEEHLEPREVKIGARTDDYYEVVSGLKEGELVVARALFLVDSESQLKAALAGLGAAGGHTH